jgi:hypothetical protein
MKSYELGAFLTESNRIEGIMMVRPEEIEAAKVFLNLHEITIEDLEEFVRATQPDARLRNKLGMNVRIGNHHPTAGGPLVELRTKLISITSFCIHSPMEMDDQGGCCGSGK